MAVEIQNIYTYIYTHIIQIQEKDSKVGKE